MAGGLLTDGALGFLGVDLRRDRLSLADGEVARAINADFHSVFGAAVMRLGSTKQHTTALSNLILRTLARVNGFRYRVAGSSLYRDTTQLTTALQTGGGTTTIAGMRPLLDNTIWAFVADAAAMRKDDGTRFYKWGIDAPTAVVSIAIGVNADFTGAYSYRHTWVRFTAEGRVGHESNPSPIGSATTAAANDLVLYDLEFPTDAQVNGIGIYRTVTGGVDHLLVDRLREPTTSEFSVTQGWEASALPSRILRRIFTLTGAAPPARSPAPSTYLYTSCC